MEKDNYIKKKQKMQKKNEADSKHFKENIKFLIFNFLTLRHMKIKKSRIQNSYFLSFMVG